MNLWRTTLEAVNWMRSLGRKFRRLTGAKLFAAVLAFMASQAMLLLAMLLPLKVILLAATDGVPWYLASLVTIETKDQFIILLAVSAIGSYGLFHLCSRFVADVSKVGGATVLAKAGKMHLFANQEDIAEQAYLRLVRVVGSLMIAILGFTLAVFVNPLVFGLVLGVMALEFIVFAGLMQRASSMGRWLADAFNRNLSGSIGVLSSVNFLIAFAILLVQFIQVDGLSFIVALLSIILARQLLQRCAAAIQDLGYLSKNRLRLQTLLYTSTRHVPLPDREQEDFLQRFRLPRRNRWLREALGQMLDHEFESLESRWLDSGMPGVVYLDVRGGDRAWLVKAYGRRHAVQAAQEAELFAFHPHDIACAPAFIGGQVYGDIRLLVFAGISGEPVEPHGFKAEAMKQLVQLWGVEADPTLVSTWRRTHSTVLDRLDAVDFSELGIAAETKNEQGLVKQWSQVWPEIWQFVGQLPLVIRNPALPGIGNWALNANGGPVCIAWGNWSLQPLGCAPHFLRLKEKQALRILNDCRASGDCRRVPTLEEIHLVSGLGVLEECFRRKNLRRALETVQGIVTSWHELESVPREPIAANS
jgi:hypothetical protein